MKEWEGAIGLKRRPAGPQKAEITHKSVRSPPSPAPPLQIEGILPLLFPPPPPLRYASPKPIIELAEGTFISYWYISVELTAAAGEGFPSNDILTAVNEEWGKWERLND
jgi:hypothetical protein